MLMNCQFLPTVTGSLLATASLLFIDTQFSHCHLGTFQYKPLSPVLQKAIDSHVYPVLVMEYLKTL